ncbi:hypothetical protein SAMN04487983_100620 [Streptomyces sp. yr375]|uniref:hypothetical protein n=1 Tax=Streptomyces sp. yr375 TaxID=1761906 RepID=UPI0008D69B42|nr:hypothetical protein [Streptomyces sp. yr375]SEQ53965.1 hypothetical protein SAMN04487983_100620 [Streptomyces sp. yr375]
MSRTVHHIRPRHRVHPAHGVPSERLLADSGHALGELRYSAEELTRARRERRRPLPVPLVRAFRAYTYPRSLNAHIDGPYESRARAALSVFRSTARNHLRAAPPGTLLTAAVDLDHPPTRHRHRNLWEC